MELTPEERFQSAVSYVLKHEGGLTNDKYDRGGITNFGISLRFLKSINENFFEGETINSDYVKSLTKGQAIEIYRRFWWDKYHYEAINDLDIAKKIFDTAVNMGPGGAHIIAQKTLNFLDIPVVIDGILGPKTLYALNKVSIEGRKESYLRAFRTLQKNYYLLLIERNKNLYKFRRGWISRAND